MRLRLRSATTASIASTACGMHKGQPFMVENATVPASPCFPACDEKAEVASRIIVLAQEYGVLLGKAEERVSLGQARPGGRRQLWASPPGTPVMVLDRVVMSLDGRPIEWRVGCCHLADKYYMAEMV